jgi:hypothetical protein
VEEAMKKGRKVTKLKVSRETLCDLDARELRQVQGAVTTPATVCNYLCTERCTGVSCYC